jgi:hypothetical protein
VIGTAGPPSRLVRAALCLATLATLAGLGSWSSDGAPRPAHSEVSVVDIFANPLPYPGETWAKGNQPVPSNVVSASAGASHCEMQSAAILFVGWPLGREATSAARRTYVRDPGGVVSPKLAKALDLHARLPAAARPTGYTVRGVELWLAASAADDGVYLVGRGAVERWPRADPLPFCA